MTGKSVFVKHWAIRRRPRPEDSALRIPIAVSAHATMVDRESGRLAGFDRLGRGVNDRGEDLPLLCSLNVSARDLAVMGATLADGGVNPLTRERLVAPIICHYTLAVMATAGLYETSGDWLFDIGLPGRSGIGGGIVTVSPGKGGLGTFAPPLDAAGNSVKGQLVAKLLSQRLGLDLFLSAPGGDREVNRAA